MRDRPWFLATVPNGELTLRLASRYKVPGLYRTIKVKCFSGEIAGTAGLMSDYGIGVVCWPRFDCKHKKKIHGHFSRLSQPITLGVRDFSSAVSGFCQVFIVTRAKWLRRSWRVSAFGQHRKFPPHARKTSGTQGSSLFEEVSKTPKKVSSDVKKPRSRWRLVLQRSSRV